MQSTPISAVGMKYWRVVRKAIAEVREAGASKCLELGDIGTVLLLATAAVAEYIAELNRDNAQDADAAAAVMNKAEEVILSRSLLGYGVCWQR